MLEIIRDLYTMQDELTSKIIGSDKWFNKIDLENILMAIMTEVGEYLDTAKTDWVWWKKKEGNKHNEIVEIVDILHFVIMFDLWRRYQGIFHLDPIDYPSYVTPLKRNTPYNAIHTLMYEIHNCYQRLENCTKYSATVSLLIKAPAFGFTEQELHDYYRLKNWLNQWRTEHGYKEGKYAKIIDGKEDTIRLFEYYRKYKDYEKAIEVFTEHYNAWVNRFEYDPGANIIT